MSRLGRSLSSEVRKVRSTKLWWILTLVLAGYSAIIAAMFAFMFGAMSDLMGGESQAPIDAAGMVYSSVTSLGYVVPLLFGALMATSELRHGTLALAFTLEPKRGIVLLSKALVLIGFGLVIGIAGLVGAVAAGAPLLATNDLPTELDSADTWLLIVRVLAAVALWALIGFGIGVLVRNQAFAIVLALVFTQFVEPMLRMGAQFWEWSAQVARFLPGAATDAFVGPSVMNSLSAVDPSAPQGADPLQIWAGALVLLGYAAVTLLGGWLLRWRGDID